MLSPERLLGPSSLSRVPSLVAVLSGPFSSEEFDFLSVPFEVDLALEGCLSASFFVSSALGEPEGFLPAGAAFGLSSFDLEAGLPLEGWAACSSKMLYTKSCFFILSNLVIPSLPAICRKSATFLPFNSMMSNILLRCLWEKCLLPALKRRRDA